MDAANSPVLPSRAHLRDHRIEPDHRLNRAGDRNIVGRRRCPYRAR
jgi:hypothetical protein